jgi:hypothetical protein
MHSPRLHHVSRLALVLASAGLVAGCGGEIGSGSTEPLTAPQRACKLALQGHEIPRTTLNIGMNGAPVDVAADRLRVTFDRGAAVDLDAMADAGMCLNDVSLSGENGTVRLVPGLSLADALGQLDTMPGIASIRLDPMLEGAKGSHGGDDDDDGHGHGHHGGGCDDDDDHGGGDDDDDHGGGDDDDDGHGHGDDDDDGHPGGGGGSDDPSLWHLAALRMGPAFDIQPDASGVTIALLDTGLTTTMGVPDAPGLETTPILAGKDFINGDLDPADDNGHGTLLAGILASTGDFPGVAPGVRILPIKVLDHDRFGTESALADGIDFAVAQGADVISMSLAFPPGYIPSFELASAVHNAAHAGVVLVAASGNHGAGEVGYPAAFGEVIAVGGGRMAKHFPKMDAEEALAVHGRSIARKVKKADYAGWGARVDVLAPGGSMDHDLDGDGFPDAIPAVGFTTTDPSYAQFMMAGTSPATVQAAGVAALLLAGGASAEAVRPLLHGTTTSIAPKGFDIFAGAGMLDARQALRSLVHGHVPEPPKLFVNPILALADDPAGNRRAIAMVEVIDEDNNPVAGVEVLAHFRGPTVHSSSAVTDALGRVIMVSNAGPADADLFEFGVDKVISCADSHPHPHGCKHEVITVPGTYAQFEEVSFRFFAAFDNQGTGIEPTPFMIFIPNDVLLPIVDVFKLSGTPGAPATPDPVDTIPTDLGSYQLVESLLVRSFGAPGSVAPTVFTVARSVLQNGCAIAERATTIPVEGGGIEPTPFRIGVDLMGLPPTFNTVVTRSDGGLFLNGSPTTESALGLLSGTVGTVMISADGSVCVAQQRGVNDLGAFASSIGSGTPVSRQGFTFNGSADAVQPPPALLDLEDTTLGRAIGQGLVSSASTGSAAEASAAVDP